MKAKFILTILLVTIRITTNYAQKPDSTSGFHFTSIKAGYKLFNEINLGAVINPTPWLGLGIEAGAIIPFRNRAYEPLAFYDFPAMLQKNFARAGFVIRHTINLRIRNSFFFPSIDVYYAKGHIKSIVADDGRDTGTNYSDYSEYSEKYSAFGGEIKYNFIAGKRLGFYFGYGIRKLFLEDHYHESGIFSNRKSVDYIVKYEKLKPSFSTGINFFIRK
jgi:hypothetical protein